MSTQPRFRILAEDNPDGQFAASINAMLISRLVSRAVNVSDSSDFPSEIDKIAQSFGILEKQRLRSVIPACQRLQYLPGFRTIACKTGCVTLQALSTIENFLSKNLTEAPTHELWQALDTCLEQVYTPSIPDQTLPTSHHIQTALARAIRRVKQANNQFGTPRATIEIKQTTTPGVSELTAQLTNTQASALQVAISKIVKTEHCTQQQALAKILLGQTLQAAYVFGTAKTPDNIQVAHLHGSEDITTEEQTQLKSKIRYYTIDAVAKIRLFTHDPSLLLRLLVMCRDGHCRYPGCSVDALNCDIDHVIDYKRGGWTTLSNLQCLCRHHHNMKTDRRVRCEMDIYGNCTWWHADGTKLGVTTPQGILPTIAGIVVEPAKPQPKPSGRNWGFTFENRARRNYQLARNRAGP